MTPPAETVHWMFATGILFLGLLHNGDAAILDSRFTSGMVSCRYSIVACAEV